MSQATMGQGSAMTGVLLGILLVVVIYLGLIGLLLIVDVLVP